MADALTEAATLSGYVWRISYARVFGFYEPASYPAPFNVTDSNKKSVGDVKVRLSRMMGSGEYANYVKVHGGTEEEPVKASAFDSAAISATGKWMVAISSPTAKDYATASALANAYLIQHLTTPKIVEFSTRERGLIPGQVLTLTFARRNINGTYLITEVETQNEEFTAIIHRVTAIEGSVFKTNWRNLYQQWTSGQTTAYAIPGAGSTVGPGRAIHFLGAFENYWVQSTAGVYVSATNHGIQPQIDTTEWGSLSATVVVRMRALSGSVMARLQNMSASTTAGESIAITNSNFETVQFTVALTPGLQTYELQLKPSLSNVDINAVGYLE
jgi:hypothetical protein